MGGLEKEELEAMCGKLQWWVSELRMHLRVAARQRLMRDMVALCSGMRAVVMIDYANKAGSVFKYQMADVLSALAQEFKVAAELRVMYLEESVYLIHPRNLHATLLQTFAPESCPKFVILDHNSAQMASEAEEQEFLTQLRTMLNSISEMFTLHLNEGVSSTLPLESSVNVSHLRPKFARSSCGNQLLLDIGNILHDSDIVLPTFNGWLLGYPIVYAFNKLNMSKAGRCLTGGVLHHYKILIHSHLQALSPQRSGCGTNGLQESVELCNELMSFTVPIELSTHGRDEPWANIFLLELTKRQQAVPQLWRAIQLDLSIVNVQAMVL